jgi:hypothetical protein
MGTAARGRLAEQASPGCGTRKELDLGPGAQIVLAGSPNGTLVREPNGAGRASDPTGVGRTDRSTLTLPWWPPGSGGRPCRRGLVMFHQDHQPHASAPATRS